MDKKNQFNVWYFVLAVFAILLIQNWWIESRKVEPIPYSQFEQLLKDGKIDEIAISKDHIQGKLKQPLDGRDFFVTTRVDPQFADELAKFNVKFSGEIQSTFVSDLLSWVLPALFFVLIWMVFVRRMAEKQGFGGLMTVG